MESRSGASNKYRRRTILLPSGFIRSATIALPRGPFTGPFVLKMAFNLGRCRLHRRAPPSPIPCSEPDAPGYVDEQVILARRWVAAYQFATVSQWIRQLSAASCPSGPTPAKPERARGKGYGH